MKVRLDHVYISTTERDDDNSLDIQAHARLSFDLVSCKDGYSVLRTISSPGRSIKLPCEPALVTELKASELALLRDMLEGLNIPVETFTNVYGNPDSEVKT